MEENAEDDAADRERLKAFAKQVAELDKKEKYRESKRKNVPGSNLVVKSRQIKFCRQEPPNLVVFVFENQPRLSPSSASPESG
ncbi:hypothetical protein Dimus_025262 [Dionaea muscipula]